MDGKLNTSEREDVFIIIWNSFHLSTSCNLSLFVLILSHQESLFPDRYLLEITRVANGQEEWLKFRLVPWLPPNSKVVNMINNQLIARNVIYK